MKNTVLIFTCVVSFSFLFCVHAEEQSDQEKPTATQEKEPLVAVACPEPSFKERQWEKKKIKASERIDQIITALLIPAIANSILANFWINRLPQSLKDHSRPITLSLWAAKLVVTLWRMHLHDLYVGGNPLKLIPSLGYFTLVDMASWR